MKSRSNDHVTIRVSTNPNDPKNFEYKNNFTKHPAAVKELNEERKQEQHQHQTAQTDLSEPATGTGHRQPSLLEQARERSSLLHIQEPDSEHTDTQSGTTRRDADEYWRRTISSNTQWTDSDYSPARTYGLAKPTRKGMLAGLLGICAGLLLGMGAYFLFTSASGISKLASLNSNHSAGTNTAAQATSGATQQQAVAANASSQSTANVLGPGGAMGSGTTIYLYQIGMFRDSNSADQVVQQLKGKGLSVIKRGNNPYQLIIGAAQTKSGFSDLNQLLHDQTVDYYMKPFIVPEIPATISQVSASSAQQLQKSLQTEWKFVEQFNKNGELSADTNVQNDVQLALNQLPPAQNEAKAALSASLQDMKDLADAVKNSGSADPKQTAKQSYLLAKFFIDFAQGVADLS